jgi:hypothetical protein
MQVVAQGPHALTFCHYRFRTSFDFFAVIINSAHSAIMMYKSILTVEWVIYDAAL